MTTETETPTTLTNAQVTQILWDIHVELDNMERKDFPHLNDEDQRRMHITHADIEKLANQFVDGKYDYPSFLVAPSSGVSAKEYKDYVIKQFTIEGWKKFLNWQSVEWSYQRQAIHDMARANSHFKPDQLPPGSSRDILAAWHGKQSTPAETPAEEDDE